MSRLRTTSKWEKTGTLGKKIAVNQGGQVTAGDGGLNLYQAIGGGSPTRLSMPHGVVSPAEEGVLQWPETALSPWDWAVLLFAISVAGDINCSNRGRVAQAA